MTRAAPSRTKGLNYSCHVAGSLDDYYVGDVTKIRQILINILGNAVKFTPKGGNINLNVEKIAAFDNKSTLVFKISDTGIGISKEFLPKIFDTFTQENATTAFKYGSSGLGMAITKGIVDMMNGKIDVESEKGKGTTFRVTLTLNDSLRKQATDDEIEIHPSGGRRRDCIGARETRARQGGNPHRYGAYGQGSGGNGKTPSREARALQPDCD